MSEPGWFADPSGLPQERYWNGSEWTDGVRPYPAPPGATPRKTVDHSNLSAPMDGNTPERKSRTPLIVGGLIAVVVAAAVGGFFWFRQPDIPPANQDFASIREMLSAVNAAGIECREQAIDVGDDGVTTASCKDSNEALYTLIWASDNTYIRARYADNCDADSQVLMDEGLDLGELGTTYFDYVFGIRWQAWTTGSEPVTPLTDELHAALGGVQQSWSAWC